MKKFILMFIFLMVSNVSFGQWSMLDVDGYKYEGHYYTDEEGDTFRILTAREFIIIDSETYKFSNKNLIGKLIFNKTEYGCYYLSGGAIAIKEESEIGRYILSYIRKEEMKLEIGNKSIIIKTRI